MKKFKYSIIATLIAALTLFVLSCSTGGDDDGGGGNGLVPAKFLFADSTFTSSPNIVQKDLSGGILKSVTTDTASFQPYEDAYNNLGTFVESITPTSLKLAVRTLKLKGIHNRISFVRGESPEGIPKIDLTAPQTLTLSDVPGGYYDIVEFGFETESMHYGPKPSSGPDTRPLIWAEVTFPWPGAISPGDTSTWINFHQDTIDGNNVTKLDEDGYVTILPKRLEVHVNEPNPKTPDTAQLGKIVFAGSVRKMTPRFFYDELIPGYPHEEESQGEWKTMLIAPFEGGIAIPGNANAVQFEIRWDLDDLIGHYAGQDNILNNSDDIFVLKNGWWNGFSIQAFIE
jgi:hypothetical protein